MSLKTQNVNSFTYTNVIGGNTGVLNTNSQEVLVNPASTVLPAVPSGAAVKLFAGASSQLLVELCSGPTDGPVFWVIYFSAKKNTSPIGFQFPRTAACELNEIYLAAAAAIPRGSKVSYVAPTWVSGVQVTDPLVKVAVSGDYVTGVALSEAANAGDFIKVQIKPSAAVL